LVCKSKWTFEASLLLFDWKRIFCSWLDVTYCLSYFVLLHGLHSDFSLRWIDIASFVEFDFRIIGLKVISLVFAQGFTNSWHEHAETSSLRLESDCSEAVLVLNFQHLFSYLGSFCVFRQ
jgi:hypothetical protein